MITLYSGTPGSGKSLHSAKDIIEWAQKGKPILTNFDVDLHRYPKANHSYVDDDDLTPDFLTEFSRASFGGRKLTKRDEDTILLIIDECQLVFNSRDYQKKDRKSWIKFFSMHRHYGYKIILVAQMDKMLDKQIRGLIEYEYVHRKLSNFGKAGKIITLLTGGELFTAVQMWYPLKMKIGSKMFRGKKRYFSIYDSYTTFGEGKQLPAAPEPAQEKNDANAPEVTSDTVPLPDLTQLPAPEPVDQSYADAPKAAPVRLHRWQRVKLRFRIWKRKHQKQGKYMRSSVRNERGWKIS